MIDPAAIGGAECGQAAIAAIGLGPEWSARVKLGAVVLAAADDDVGVSWVQADAFELDRVLVAVDAPRALRP